MIRCDGADCLERIEAVGAILARDKAQSTGWSHYHGDRDYCPLHAKIELDATAKPIDYKGHRIIKTTTANRWQAGTMVRVEGPLYDRPVHCANVRNAKLRIDGDRKRASIGLEPTPRRYGGTW